MGRGPSIELVETATYGQLPLVDCGGRGVGLGKTGTGTHRCVGHREQHSHGQVERLQEGDDLRAAARRRHHQHVLWEGNSSRSSGTFRACLRSCMRDCPCCCWPVHAMFV